VLITSGPCREPVDDVRVLTTRSTGRIGRALALEAFRLGAEVAVVHRDTFPCVQNVTADTAGEMREAVLRWLSENDGADIYISAAAISDFAPVRAEGKIASGKRMHLGLQPLPKLLDEVVRRRVPVTVAFKLGGESGKKAAQMLAKGVTMVLVNEPATMGSSEGDYILLTADGKSPLQGSKEAIAHAFWEKAIPLL
jgi:phosphopantothenoylcysteine decarboxylase/phosphopantothenate--cysteine ligase